MTTSPPRTVVKYNLPLALTEAIRQVAHRQNVRPSAIAEALLTASVERLAAGLDEINTPPPRVTPACAPQEITE